MTRQYWLSLMAGLLIGVAGLGAAQELDERVSEFELGNGLRVIFVEQDAAPVISINFMFDVGAVDEPEGLGGIAHMVEHMAFKGTSSIGSLDPEAERDALARIEVEELSLQWVRKNGSEDEIAAQEARLAEALAVAQGLAQGSPLSGLLSVNGGVGLNASTGRDRTDYRISLPANRLELYARVYADVLRDTTFRYFYEEADVVREERRQRSEDDPQGALFEAFSSEAFDVHPYGRPTIGSAEEIDGYTATAAKAFFETFYYPNRAVMVIVGDVTPNEDIEIIERYFGDLEPGPDLRPIPLREPPQMGEKRIQVPYDAAPQIAIGYHKPTYPNRDAYVFDLIQAILSSGRTSRLYERMIVEDGSALDTFTGSSFPGSRYDNLFVFYGLPRTPSVPADLEAAFYDELEQLKNNVVSDEELQKVKNQVRAETLFSLSDAESLAGSLAFNELFAGGWEALLADLDIYDSVTPEEIQTVAQTYFTQDNRTVATLVREGGN